MNTFLTRPLGLAALFALGFAAAGSAQAATCTYAVNNEWNTGFRASITITNNGTAAVSDWNVGWQYTRNKITSSWNATVAGTNPYTATALNWNNTIPAGGTISFGFQGDKQGGVAEIPTITGAVCQTTASSTSSSSSKISSASSSTVSSVMSSSIKSSSASSVSSSVASSISVVQRCNWYGQIVALCKTTPSGWGYENNQSCVARSTCSAQPAPYGITGGTSSTSSFTSSSRSSVVSSSSKSSVVSSSSSVVSSKSSSVISSLSSSSTSSTNGSRLDNPFIGAVWYVDPIWSAKAMAETGGSKVAKYNTAVWMDRIGAIAPTDGSWGLRDHLDAALAQKANLIQVVVYDLPNRDCNALASNGELTIENNGFNRYKNEYVAPLAAIFADPKYKALRIIAIIEPDSLPNLVTNMGVPKCAASAGAGGYVEATQYTLNQLYPISNVYSYVDIGHSGWLGWDDNMAKATTFIANAIKGTANGVNSIAGFVSNTANTTPLKEPFLDAFATTSMPGSNGGTQVRQAKFYEWNPHFSETSFVQAWRTNMIALGFPSTIGMLIDTSRNGWGGANRPTALSTSTVLDTFVNDSRIDRRYHRGNWCNQASGIGERPTVAPEPGIDAYVWVKPPGESDGAASLELSHDPQDPAKGFDRFCDPTFTTKNGTLTGSLPNAPVAGRWFPAGFQVLLKNAYPPLD